MKIVDACAGRLRANPVFERVLGLCSAIAVTAFVHHALAMAAAILLTATVSALLVSLVRASLPQRARLVVHMAVIAAVVTCANLAIAAFLPDLKNPIAPYVALLVTNCLILGRCELHAAKTPPLSAMANAFTTSLGYAAILLAIAVPRELIGHGSLCGFQVLPGGFKRNLVLAAPAGVFFLAATWIWISRAIRPENGEGGRS